MPSDSQSVEPNCEHRGATPEAFSVVLGNPPFVGKQYQTAEQKRDLAAVLRGIPGAGVLDFVTGWFVKAAQYMAAHPETRTAFVSTNSVSQGEQVGVLWNELMTRYGCQIHFAHRPFAWANEASGKAAVHVVIEGFGPQDVAPKRLFDYDTPRGEPHERAVQNINPYLVEAADVVVLKRRTQISGAPLIQKGSQPTDGGFLLLDDDEKRNLIAREPQAVAFIRPCIGSREFINSIPRWSLWLKHASAQDIRAMPLVRERVEGVREARQSSTKASTRAWASRPTVFTEDRQPERDFLAIPEVSSESRDYIPIGYLSSDVIVTNKIYTLQDATFYHLGVLSSAMHMAWMRYTAGRLKSDYSYSNSIVYNNFPWPEATEAQKEAVAAAAEAVLAARAPHLAGGATLADLYDPLAMPPALVAAHRALDAAVDRAYRRGAFADEAARVALLFDRYEALANPLAVRA